MLMILTQMTHAKKPTYYGVIIGCCGQYKNNQLQALHAKDDAKNFYNDLIKRYYGGNSSRANGKVYLLTETKATKANIKAKLKTIAQKAKKGDFVYFFYSGHGSSLSDKNIKINEYNTEKLIAMMHDSGLIMPYDFNIKKTSKTAIIGSRDLRENNGFGFKRLDNNGVQIIMISDSCYAGNMYRGSEDAISKAVPNSKLSGIESDFLNLDKKKHKNKKDEGFKYNNLIFFGAGAMDKMAAESKEEKRGKFSLVLEKCLKTANLNNDNKITNKELRECLRSEDLTEGFVHSPDVGKQNNSIVFKTRVKDIHVNTKDYLRIKSSIKSISKIEGITIDSKNYEIEIVKSGNKYNIFRYTGELYAIIEPKNIKEYIEAFKIFKLKGNGKLTMKAKSLDTEKSESAYCKDERIVVDIKEKNIGNYIVALTLNKNGGVIMLQPNNKQESSRNIIETKVESPYGMDKLKVFALTSKKQYDNIKKLIKSDGHVKGYSVNKLYNILKKNKQFKEDALDIQTIKRSIINCKKGR